MTTKDNQKRIVNLFIIGATMTFAGFLLQYGCPLNKKIWSPTFVLATCGLASTLLALLIWVIDIKGYKKGTVFFESFGINPLFIYVLAAVLSILLGNIQFMYDGSILSVKEYVYGAILQPSLNDYFGSLVFAILFVGINWLTGHFLYKKKIYIKI
jgi:predicted acyltransferase